MAAGGEKKYLSAKSKIQLLLLVLFRHWAVYIWVKINVDIYLLFYLKTSTQLLSVKIT